MMARVLAATMLAALMGGVAGAQVPGASACKVIQPDAMDGPIVEPSNHAVLYEDQDVRVLDVHSAPHTVEKMHTHARPAVMYTDRQGAGRYFTPQDSVGRSHPTDPNFKFKIMALPPETLHATENTGDVPFHAIRVEFKHPGCSLDGSAVKPPGPEDAVAVAPSEHRVLLENDDVRVLDVLLPPHSKEPSHTHAWPGFFYIEQAEPLRYFTPAKSDPPVVNLPAKLKIVPVAPEGPHWVENEGDAPLHFVRFELKHGTVKPEAAPASGTK